VIVGCLYVSSSGMMNENTALIAPPYVKALENLPIEKKFE
jgi:hypothetical protein